MTEAERTAKAAAFFVDYRTKRVNRESTGLFESVIYSLLGLAITVLLIADGISIATQLAPMQ
jgi:hypothetical protein